MGMWEQGQEVLWDHPGSGGERSKRMNHENNKRLKDRARSSLVHEAAGCDESACSLTPIIGRRLDVCAGRLTAEVFAQPRSTRHKNQRKHVSSVTRRKLQTERNIKRQRIVECVDYSPQT